MSYDFFPPTVPRYRSILNVSKFIKNPFPVLDEAVDAFGKTYSFFMGGAQKAVLTVDAEIIKQVLQKHHRIYEKSEIVTDILAKYVGKGLLTNIGDQWLRQRRLIQPGFHRKRIESLESLMRIEIDACMEIWKIKSAQQEIFDVFVEMNKLTFAIVARTLFSTSLEASGLHQLSELISTIQDFIVKEVRQPYKRWWYALTGQTKHHVGLAHSARELIRQNITLRKNATEQPDDLLGMLLEARYEDTGQPMDEEQLIDECLILFVAGHETSANAMAWMIYLLGKHPAEWKKLREASKSVSSSFDSGFAGASPASTSLASTNVMRNVVLETLRLHPPAWVVDRVSLADDDINDWHFPKGTIWIIYIRGMHRQPEYWPLPDDFIPERWDRPDVQKDAFMPFGAGPRLCIGEHFAMMEMQVILESIVKCFDFELKTAVVKDKPLVTLRPDRPIMIQLGDR
jgi:cytochrome P450